jgi:hypothetical protein
MQGLRTVNMPPRKAMSNMGITYYNFEGDTFPVGASLLAMAVCQSHHF